MEAVEFCVQLRTTTYRADVRLIAVVGRTEVHAVQRVIEAVAQFCCIAYHYSLSP